MSLSTAVHRWEAAQCYICDKSFSQAGDLKKHILLYGRKKPHVNQLCDKEFTTAGYLKGHMLVHSGGKPHRCYICDICSSEADDLK